MDNGIAIKVEHVGKTFKLPHEKQTSIKGALISKLHGGSRSFERQQVLKDVSFEIKRGEFFGIVGRNGSGKSTLLKMLAGIYTPTGGSIQVNGKLTPFIELGVGFNPELTGRENVFLNGALLGFNRREMEAMYADIVEFAELGKFMDQKLKNYSSGMQVRLAFSIAIRARSDILLIDEVLAVGDIAFQRKCIDYFEQLKREGQTVILVSHDMAAVEKHCTSALLLHDGEVLDVGDTKKIAAQYRLLNVNNRHDPLAGLSELAKDVAIESVTIDGGKEVVVGDSQDMAIEITYRSQKPRKYVISVSITRDEDDLHIAFYDTRHELAPTSVSKGGAHKAVCRFNSRQFLGGVYRVDVDIRDEHDIYLVAAQDVVRFSVENPDPAKAGALNLNAQWQIGKA